ncbi:MAG: type III-A CRISPR-associated RAMP protein Csm5 [Selenomonas sp.]|nr:type III-A CRISPR-associated RAMP protein Csm5 [Selenomonas sp.]
MRSGEMVCRAYDLVTVAPVHVGSGEIRRANEYLYDKAHSMAYFLNETRWVAFLDKRQLMEPFLAYIEESSRQLGQRRGPFRGKNLWDWLRAQGVQPREMEALAVRRTRAERCVISEKGSLNDVHLQMALSDGRPYVPGSTIKGALRTGILYRLIRQEPERFRGFWQEICREAASREKAKDKERTWQGIERRLETQALHTLRVDRKNPAEMVNSALRGLRVSDAAVAKRETETLLLQKLDATTKPNRQGITSKTLPLFRECIPPGRRLHFTLTADFSMLRTIGITSFEDIFQGLRAYTAQALALLEEEFPKYRPQFDEARETDCLLGGGTGFLSKTLVCALARDAREARDFTAQYLDEKFGRFDRQAGKWRPTHHHVRLDGALSPRTLKLAATAQEEWLLGLCRFEECPR